MIQKTPCSEICTGFFGLNFISAGFNKQPVMDLPLHSHHIIVHDPRL